jgi:predicted MPP superfamily phosphohydrolase
MKTIILRFSDAEREGTSVSTSDAHQDIISKHGSVWWGWWKKKHEVFRQDLLEQIDAYARAQKIRIGLVNRKGVERLYFAQCEECVTKGGDTIPSPDPSLTPKYYAGDSFPAWFKLSRIELVERPQFEREFGQIPSLDPTLYEVIVDGSQIKVIPARTWNLEPVQGRGDAILHISDMHFGEGHGYPLASTAGRNVDVPTLCKKLADGIRTHVRVPIGAVVASGDFITKGNANSYPAAEMFLQELLNELKLEKQHCIVVPGNHDLWTIDTDHPTRTYEHEAPYRMFLGSFRHEDIQDLERITRIRTPGGFDLVFVALNSARIRSDKLKEYGYVSRHRYEELLRYLKSGLLANPIAETALVFVVLHHHIVPVAKVDVPDGVRPVSLTLDAGELIEEFCKADIGYVLHGHQHLPFVGLASKINASGAGEVQWKANKGNLFVLGCGSTGGRHELLPPEFSKNIFAVYTPTVDAFGVKFFQFSPHERCSLYWTGSLPLQNYYKTAAM